MFTATPPTATWTAASGSGNDFYQKYMEAQSSYSSTGGANAGSATQTHASATGVPSGTSTPLISFNPAGGHTVVAGNHSHTVDLAYGNADNLPSYINVIVSKKVNVTLGVTAPASFTMPSGTANSTTTYTFSTSELVTVTDAGAGWTLSVSFWRCSL